MLSNVMVILKKNSFSVLALKTDITTSCRNGEWVYFSGLFPQILVFQPIMVTELEDGLKRIELVTGVLDVLSPVCSQKQNLRSCM